MEKKRKIISKKKTRIRVKDSKIIKNKFSLHLNKKAQAEPDMFNEFVDSERKKELLQKKLKRFYSGLYLFMILAVIITAFVLLQPYIYKAFYHLSNNSSQNIVQSTYSKENLVSQVNNIPIVDAEQFYSRESKIENVFTFVKKIDNNYTMVKSSDSMRVYFSQNLSNKDEITIYAKGDNSEVGVYRKDSVQELAMFVNIDKEGYYKIPLSKLGAGESEDVFDLKVLYGQVSFDYIEAE